MDDELRPAAADVAELFRQGLKLAKQLLGEQPGFYPLELVPYPLLVVVT